MSLDNKEFTFWNLISKYTIEIPAIQRDYVQDRLYSDLKQEDSDIVGDIVNSLQNNTKLNLHFVYGKVDNNELIPLDGQQRLTTLFLIHWFLSLGTISDSDKQILSKFTYETRPSSEDFCLKLVKESIIYQNGLSIKQQIVNSKWFFLSWKSDPTIKAMLNMLDVIQDKFNKPNKDLFELLREKNCPVTFNFLPLEEFKLDDEIYVKMNSRGKPLSDFEKFKANFSVLFDFDEKSKLDNEWLDIFWKFEKDKLDVDIQEVDRKYLTFIKNISLCFYAEYNDFTKEERDNFSIFNTYKTIYASNTDYLNQIIEIFKALTNYNDTDKYFEDFLDSNPDYWAYLRFYAVSKFFIHCGTPNSTNFETYNKWIRTCKNLINNTLVQGPEEFYKAIRAIKELTTSITNIYEYLCSSELKISGFLNNQFEEEKIKAKLILNDTTNSWLKAITDIENETYFDGQIGFILHFSKNDTNYDYNKFVEYSGKLKKLFSSEFQDNYDCLFQRALLTFGNYVVPISGHYTFCRFENNLRAKMDNWRKVFNDEKKCSHLIQLLDTIKIDTIKNDLENIVEYFQVDQNNWMSLFIKNKGIIEYCNNYQINIENNHIDLARSPARLWRKKAELRSYVFYKTMLEGRESTFPPFGRVWYYDSSDSIPCAVLDYWMYQDKYNFALDIYFEEDKFVLNFYDRSNLILPKEIIEKLNQINFISDIGITEDKDELIKSCTFIISDKIDLMKVEQKIMELLKI